MQFPVINLMELNVNKTKNKFSLLIVLLSLAAVNCVSLPAPAAPVDVQAYKGKPQAEREKKYQENLIDSAGSGYKINGAQLTAQQIHPLFSAGYVSEPTRSLFNSHSRWETTGTIFGAVGGGFLGWMIGLQLNSGLSKSTKDSLGPGYFWGIGGYSDAKDCLVHMRCDSTCRRMRSGMCPVFTGRSFESTPTSGRNGQLLAVPRVRK